MAGRDFAKVEAPSRQPSKSTNRRTVEGGGNNNRMVGMLAVLAVGFFGGYMLGKEHAEGDSGAIDAKQAAEYEETIKQQDVELKILQAQVDTMAQQDKKAADKLGDLTFYSELPNQSVTPAPLTEPDDKGMQEVLQPKAVTAETKVTVASKPIERHSEPAKPVAVTPGVTPSGSYRVQAGSFRDVSDTATLVRKLNGIGLQASVQMVDLKSKGQWHRVYIGPFASREDADKVNRQIKDRLGINGLVSK